MRAIGLSWCWSLLAVIGFSTMAASAEGPLRYAWKADSEHHYRVKIEVELNDGKEEYIGTPFYRVASRSRSDMVLHFYGGLERIEKPSVPRFPPGFTPPHDPSLFTGKFIERAAGLGLPESDRKLKINDRGKLIAEEGRTELPYLLGDLAQLVIFPMPKGDEKSWNNTREITITSFATEYRPRSFPQIDHKSLPAELEASYTIEGTAGNVTTVNEEFTLTSLEQVREKPVVEIVSRGKRKFDTSIGAPISYEAKVNVTVRQKNLSVEFPISITMLRRTDDELAKVKKDAADAIAKAKSQVAEMEVERTKPVGPAEAADLVKMLRSGNKEQVTKALRRLSAKAPERPDRRISEAIEPLLKNSDFSISYSAINALKNWGTEDCVPALIEVLDGKNVSIKSQAVEVLAKFPSRRVVEELAAMLTDSSASFQAAQALKTMGKIAEDPTLAQLRTTAGKEPTHQMYICQVLQEIGGAKSLAALKPLASQEGFQAYHAKQAYTEIERRVERDKRRGK